MERLTYRLNDQCDNPTDSIILKPYLRYEDPETRKKILNRLAAYEDTGLTPEEIERVVDAYGRGHTLRTESAERLEIVREIKTDRLRELAKAEKDGRLEVLPCKVGDHILADGREAIVVWFFGYKTGRYLHAQFLDNAECADIPFYEIGKNRLSDPSGGGGGAGAERRF